MGTSQKEAVPFYQVKTAHFYPPSDEFNLIVQVSNFSYARGGIWFLLHFGTPDQISDDFHNKAYYAAVKSGSLLIMTIYY